MTEKERDWSKIKAVYQINRVNGHTINSTGERRRGHILGQKNVSYV